MDFFHFTPSLNASALGNRCMGGTSPDLTLLTRKVEQLTSVGHLPEEHVSSRVKRANLLPEFLLNRAMLRERRHHLLAGKQENEEC